MSDFSKMNLSALRDVVAKIEKAAGRPTTEIRQRWKKQECLDYLTNEGSQPEKLHKLAIVKTDSVAATGCQAEIKDVSDTESLQLPPYISKDKKSVFDLSRLTLGSEIAAGGHVVTFVVDKLIPEQSISLFYAKGGAGKSTLATQIGAAVSCGKPFMGLNTNKRPVVVIDYENPLAVLKKRIDAVEGSGQIYFWPSSDNPPQLNNKGWINLKSLVDTLKNPLLFIDTLSSSCSALDILSNGDFSPVMQKIVELRNCGSTIVLLHHTPKQDETKYIGASCIYNQCDHILAMYPVKAAGAEKEVADEDDAKTYRLGTKDKTRFDHHVIYVEFDGDKAVFVPAADPDDEILLQLWTIISESEPVNQSNVFQKAGSIAKKAKLTRLLKINVGVLWTVGEGDNNAKLYRTVPVSRFSAPIETKTEKPDSCKGVKFEKPMKFVMD